jgi:carboxymethylenebutenolidase
LEEIDMKHILAALIVIGLVSSVPGQEAKQKLEKSPRHLEWAKVKSGNRTLHCFLAYPELKDKTMAVLVIHENKGLTDWDRSVADQLAEAGFLAIAPDLLSGAGPKGGRTSDFKSKDEATEALYQLKQEQITADLNAAADYALSQPACNGKLSVVGFCWGGGQALRYATERKKLQATFVFYGTFPHMPEDLMRISSPVYGFYGSNDARINATIPKTAEQMKQAGKVFEPVIYEGAGHGFMRAGEDPKGLVANQKARLEAWERWKTILKKLNQP